MVPTLRRGAPAVGDPDGCSWELLPHERGVIALVDRATVAEAHIWASAEQATIEFWVDGPELPPGLAGHLVGQAFAHPAVDARSAVLVCLPRGNAVLLRQVLRHLENARAHDAGMARFVEGSVANTVPSRTG